MKKLIIAILLFVLVVVAVPLIAIRYTAAPLHVAAFFLKKYGVELKNISGNLSKGFTIGSIIQKSESSDFELKNAKILYPSIAAMKINEKMVIDQISVDEFRLVITKYDKETVSSNQNQPPRDQSMIKKQNVSRREKIKHPILFKKILIQNGVVQLPEMPIPFELNQLNIEDLEMNDQGVKLAKGDFLSNKLDVHVYGLTVTENAYYVQQAFNVRLKAGLLPILKKEIPLYGTFNIENNKGTFDFNGFDQKLTLNLSKDDSLSLNLKDFDLREYLRITTDIEKANFSISTKNFISILSGQYQLNGTIKAFGRDFKIQQLKNMSNNEEPLLPGFNFISFEYVSSNHDVQMVLDFSKAGKELTEFMRNPFIVKDISAPLRLNVRQANTEWKLSDHVSKYYMNKLFVKLKPSEKNLIMADIAKYNYQLINNTGSNLNKSNNDVDVFASPLAKTQEKQVSNRTPSSIMKPLSKSLNKPNVKSFANPSAKSSINNTVKSSVSKGHR